MMKVIGMSRQKILMKDICYGNRNESLADDYVLHWASKKPSWMVAQDKVCDIYGAYFGK